MNDKHTTPRAQYIKDHFTLTQLPDGQWEARALRYEKISPQYSRIIGDRQSVLYRFRAQWGHFNFEDEARAFNEVFR